MPRLASDEIVDVECSFLWREGEVEALGGDGIDYWSCIKAQAAKAPRRLGHQPYKRFPQDGGIDPAGSVRGRQRVQFCSGDARGLEPLAWPYRVDGYVVRGHFQG